MVGRSPPAAHPRRTTPRRSAAALRPAHARPSCLHWTYRQPPVTPGDATSPIPGEPDQERSLNEEYATSIARDWNVKHSGVGYVTRFRVRRDFIDRYDVHQVGGQTILE